MKIFSLLPHTILASISKTAFDTPLTRPFVSYEIISIVIFAEFLLFRRNSG